MDQKVENLPPISTRDRRKNGIIMANNVGGREGKLKWGRKKGMIIANNVEGREGNLEWREEKGGGPMKNLMEGKKKKRIGTRR